MENPRVTSFWRDESGATLVEHTVTIFGFLVILFGIIEFSFMFYQWNAASKAVQFAARRAAVSNPVSSDLSTMTGVSNTVLPGQPMPFFDRVCLASNASGSSGSCSGGGTYSAANMQMLVFGRDGAGVPRTTCNLAETSGRLIGMCNFFDRLQANNVSVRYENTDLGYAGRPGGPIPTITVWITNLTFQHIFLGDLLGMGPTALPGMATTVTGEDLRVTGS